MVCGESHIMNNIHPKRTMLRVRGKNIQTSTTLLQKISMHMKLKKLCCCGYITDVGLVPGV